MWERRRRATHERTGCWRARSAAGHDCANSCHPSARHRRRLSVGRVAEILDRIRRQGPNANKTSNGNGSLKWIQKGGGYYSECNKRLKS
jgi:hypothetical protein